MNYRELNRDLKGMNTKKSILFWWKQLGFITERIHDLQSLYKCIDDSIKVEELYKNETTKYIILDKQNWKYKMWLLFINKECVSISGF